MQRHEQIIQLSNHVKNKLKQHQQHSAAAATSFINSSDEFIEINSTDDENELDSQHVTPPEHTSRPRRDTKGNGNGDVSVLQEKYKKQQECDECVRRERIIHLQRQDLIRLYNQNKELNDQLRASVLLNRRYGNDIQKLKQHLSKVNSHLSEYQLNYDHLKQNILSEKKSTSVEGEEKHELDEVLTADHLKRLRYEIQMYNRLVVAKDKQEEKDSFF